MGNRQAQQCFGENEVAQPEPEGPHPAAALLRTQSALTRFEQHITSIKSMIEREKVIFHRIGLNCTTWPRLLTDNLHQSPELCPRFGPTLCKFG
jgi:hypothetical protein